MNHMNTVNSTLYQSSCRITRIVHCFEQGEQWWLPSCLRFLSWVKALLFRGSEFGDRFWIVPKWKLLRWRRQPWGIAHSNTSSAFVKNEDESYYFSTPFCEIFVINRVLDSMFEWVHLGNPDHSRLKLHRYNYIYIYIYPIRELIYVWQRVLVWIEKSQ